MKAIWTKMKLRWKFVCLCSLVMLVQFTFSNTYLFSNSADLVEEQGEMLVGKYVSQNKGNIENSMKSVMSAANLLLTSEDFQQYMRKYAVRFFQYDSANIDFQFDCMRTFRNIITQTGYIREIQVHLEDNTFSISRSSYSSKPNLDPILFDKVTAAPRSTVGWNSADANGVIDLYYRLPLSASGKTSGIRGWVDVIIDPDVMFQSIADLVPTADSVQMFVVDPAGEALYTNQLMTSRSVVGSGFVASVPEVDNIVIQKSNGDPIMTQSARLMDTDWLLLSIIPKENFQIDLAEYLRISFFILLIPILILALMILFLTDYLLRPLKQLVSVMSGYSENKATPQIMIERLDEFGLLANRFNKMMGKIEEQITTIRETEQQKREAEMDAFQSQIRQHFLYNTLALISWTARREKAQETERISKLFARYYRLALGKGETYTLLEKEIEMIGHYLEIQRSRFVDQMEYEMRVEAPIGGYRIIRNMLQPIVENAVEHGVLPQEKGKVLLLIREEQDYLVIRIIDDGIGAEEEVVRHINSGMSFDSDNGFSLRSIKRTLHTYYGDEAVFDFQSVIQSGSVTTIKLPKDRIT
ncbi:sensor histidine kinase [Paenibacillus xylanexedens]|uniref:sensor histidine kinase n=1 Tax=Paenibacillus xylanexedens TaxID=528191 RepID=UPI0011AA8B2B|nr:histidine kinase [Paenibacillus xylanexedens]